MAAAYQTGTATDPVDLLNQFVTLLQAQGWTLDSSAVDGSGKRAHLHKSSDYVNLRAAVNEAIWPNLSGSAFYGIGVYMGTGYNGSNGWAAQAGGPIKNGGSDTVGASMRLASGAITAFHFFDDGSDNIVLVVERAGSKFTHLGFGRSINKSGTWTGGQYFFAALAGKYGAPSQAVNGDDNTDAGAPFAISQLYNVSSNLQLGFAAFVRADVDSFTGKWIGFSSTGTVANDGYTGKLGHSGIEYNVGAKLTPTDIPSYSKRVLHSVSTFNGQAVDLPINLFAQRDTGGYSFLGQVPNLFASGAVDTGGFARASIQTVNGKNFMLFPRFAVRKLA